MLGSFDGVDYSEIILMGVLACSLVSLGLRKGISSWKLSRSVRGRRNRDEES